MFTSVVFEVMEQIITAIIIIIIIIITTTTTSYFMDKEKISL